MASWVRLAALASFAGLGILGLALGAESQKEFVLESDLEAQGEVAAEGAAGNLVALTAILVAASAAGGLVLLSRLPVTRRVGPAALVFLAAYGATLLVQTMWPFYVAALEQRQAVLTNSVVAANLPAVPSVLLAPFALLLATIIALGNAGRRLTGGHRNLQDAPPRQWLQAQAAATLLATPFLAIVAWGNLRLLLALPDDRPGLGPYFVVLPAIVLGCLALVALGVAKTWHLGAYVRNARLAAASTEAWQGLGRIESAVLAALAGLAVAGTFLQPLAMDELEVGRVLGVTLRGHTQMLVLLAVPLAPGLLLHRPLARRLGEAPVHPATLDDGTEPLALATVLATASAVGLAAFATWVAPKALWAWLLAFAPVAALAAMRCGPRLAAPAALLLAFALWGIGNTVEATYSGGQASVLAFVTPPGVLALWRTLAAVVASATLARLLRGLGPAGGRSLPIAIGAGMAAAAVALLEMPLTAWLLNRPGVDAIAVGSMVASLDPPVRATLHTVSTLLGVTAALLVALLHRPDWFARPPRRPTAVVRPKATRAPADAPA